MTRSIDAAREALAREEKKLLAQKLKTDQFHRALQMDLYEGAVSTATKMLRKILLDPNRKNQMIEVLHPLYLLAGDRDKRNLGAWCAELVLPAPPPLIEKLRLEAPNQPAATEPDPSIKARAAAHIEGSSYRMRQHADLLPPVPPPGPRADMQPKRRGRPPKAAANAMQAS